MDDLHTTLGGDAKLLLYEDAQRGTTGFDDTVFTRDWVSQTYRDRWETRVRARS